MGLGLFFALQRPRTFRCWALWAESAKKSSKQRYRLTNAAVVLAAKNFEGPPNSVLYNYALGVFLGCGFADLGFQLPEIVRVPMGSKRVVCRLGMQEDGRVGCFWYQRGRGRIHREYSRPEPRIHEYHTWWGCAWDRSETRLRGTR